MSQSEAYRAEASVSPDAARNFTSDVVLDSKQSSFNILFWQHPQPMWVFDVNSLEFLAVNDAAVAFYGYSREQFLKMLVTEIRPPEEVPRLLDYVKQIRVGIQYSGQWRHMLASGQVVDMSIIAHAIRFEGRDAILVLARDVTKEKQAEEALRKYKLIFDEAVVGIYQTLPDGRLLVANPAMARIFGYDSAEELLTSIYDVRAQLYVNPERRDDFRRQMDEYGVVQDFEVEIYRKDRSRAWLLTNARAIRENGEIVRYEGTTTDITERKLLEDQLRQAQKMEAVGRLAGGVAHDFNNALGIITGYSDLLQMRIPTGEPLRKYAEEIAKAGHRAAGLTRQLLAFSRKQVIQPVVLDLNSVTGDLEKMLRRLIGEDIEISFRRHARLGRVMADPGQIEQIIMNLAVNARDAMPRGGKLLIETANAEIDDIYSRQNPFVSPGSFVLLSISDNGCGMDRQTQAHIFEPFFTTKEPGKGTGLGLSTVYGIVKQNLGFIQVYSELGKGTTFKIYLPRVSKARQTSSARESAVIPRGTASILLVEDEPGLRDVAKTCLLNHGYRVLDAEDAKGALAVAAQNPGAIDLLLTDVVMPGISGHELAGRLNITHPGIKVLYMSGYTNDLIAQYGVMDRDILLLEKPFTLHSLLSKVHRALSAGANTAGRAANAP